MPATNLSLNKFPKFPRRNYN